MSIELESHADASRGWQVVRKKGWQSQELVKRRVLVMTQSGCVLYTTTLWMGE